VKPPDDAAPRRRILLVVHDSPEGADAAAIAGHLARLLSASVTMLSLTHSFDRRIRAYQRADEAMGEVPARERLSAVGLIEWELPRIANAGKYDLVVLARLGGLDALTGRLLVPLTVRHIHTNVLLVRGKRRTIQNVLACTAGSGASDPVDAAIDLAQRGGARLHVLHVLSHMPLESEGPLEIGQLLELEHPAAQALANAERALRARGVQGGVRTRVGLVVEEIVQEVHDGGYDLVVVGSHESTRGGRLTLDVADYVIGHVPSSVLVVRAWAP